MPRRLLNVLCASVAALVTVGGLTACSDDEPSREDAVAVLVDACDAQVGAITRLGSPRDVFDLADIGEDAVATMGRTLRTLRAEDLSPLDEPTVATYLERADRAKSTMATLADAAGLEDVRRLDRAVREAGRDAKRLDKAARMLDLPTRCGARAWGGSLVRRAATVADGEVEAMEPTGDLVDDVTTYCGRYRRALGRAPEPGDLEDDGAWAAAVGHALELFGDRLRRLDPTPERADAFDALTQAVEETSDGLRPAEVYANDGKEAELQGLVDDARAGLRRVDALVVSLGVDC